MSLASEGKGTAKRVGRPHVNALGSAVLTWMYLGLIWVLGRYIR